MLPSLTGMTSFKAGRATGAKAEKIICCGIEALHGSYKIDSDHLTIAQFFADHALAGELLEICLNLNLYQTYSSLVQGEVWVNKFTEKSYQMFHL